MRSVIAVLLLTLMACGPRSGSIPVQVVVPADAKMSTFVLGVVTLPRLIDLEQLQGERFRFYAGENLTRQTYNDIYTQSDSFESARATLTARIGKTPVSVNVSWNGQFYECVDFDSLYMLTAYYWFEQVADFFNDVVQDRSKARTTPVSVRVYGALTTSGFIKIPSAFLDNSAYLPLEDSFKVYRIGDQEGLPYEMNPGVITHEYHHRVFHDLLFERLGKPGYALWKKLSDFDGEPSLTRVRVIVHALDEALSDIHGVAFTKNVSFLGSGDRDLEGRFAAVATYDNLADSSIDVKWLPMCKGASNNYTNPSWRYYCLGTVIARTLWEASDKDALVLRSYLPAINRALATVGDRLNQDPGRFDLHVFWDALVREVDVTGQKKLCDRIRERFQSLMPRITQCG